VRKIVTNTLLKSNFPQLKLFSTPLSTHTRNLYSHSTGMLRRLANHFPTYIFSEYTSRMALLLLALDLLLPLRCIDANARRSKRWPAARRRDRNREVDENGRIVPAHHVELDMIYASHQQQQPALRKPADTIIHTFGTPDACERSCERPCVAQELEDLGGMQRWVCSTKVSIEG